jgi:acid phosphatase type 7
MANHINTTSVIQCTFIFFLTFFLVSCTDTSNQEYQPVGLYLTWQDDPTTTMTIDWHIKAGEVDNVPSPVLFYKEVGSDSWREVQGSSHDFPYSDRTIYRVELTELDPETYYRFRMSGFEREFQFRTMPEDVNRPIRFAAGGDVRHVSAMMERTGAVVAEYAPDFIVFGGDLAYAAADPRNVYRWYEWFEVTRDTFVAPDGRIIPVIVGIGNHEVFASRRLWGERLPEDHAETEWSLRDGDAPFFEALFAFPRERTYDVLDFGDYLALLLLDTNHVARIAGEQAAWLAARLAERQDVTHVFPVYHVPAYPSVRSYRGATSQQVREHWVPLFERYGVRVAFENHDHAYKRTHPLRGGELAPDGIVYLGDGAWGVSTRTIGRDHEPGEGWYLARAESYRHAIIVTLDGGRIEAEVVDEHGRVFDRVTLPEQQPAAALSAPLPDR